ncbi:MAG: hypothetical protein A3E84_05890 [Gammaproteobacteria bacterium RIFCSPHIGHO2_12_FULL_42_13]|nr:MAG: hypothetical protein A3E84_05890 [Gammaproteobacteria bacterium RIFCSPHIGHO2_12_FULL_42_13]
MTAYNDLTQQQKTLKEKVFGPGDVGRKRAEFITTRLNDIEKITSKTQREAALTVLLAAIVESKIFSSLTGNLKNLLLLHLLGEEKYFEFKLIVKNIPSNYLNQKFMSFKSSITQHRIFKGLENELSELQAKLIRRSGIAMFQFLLDCRSSLDREGALEAWVKSATRNQTTRVAVNIMVAQIDTAADSGPVGAMSLFQTIKRKIFGTNDANPGEIFSIN